MTEIHVPFSLDGRAALEDLWKNGAKILENAKVEEARLDAWLLLEYVSGYSRAYYLAHKDQLMPKEQTVRYFELIHQRAGRIPLQHITQQAFFMGHEFYVDERVLIPRQDTELLAELALSFLKGKENCHVLDLCTGSGCLLISLLLEKEDMKGTGVDISGDALLVAGENARRLGVSGRASFAKGDLFDDAFFQDMRRDSLSGFDLLVSNPPYIPTEMIGTLAPEVKDHDPYIALDGGPDGLVFYRRIVKEAGTCLKKGAAVLFEIGSEQGEAVSALMEENGYRSVQVHKDLSGADRVVSGVYD